MMMMVMMTMMMVMTMCCVFETSTDAASWMTRPSLSLGTRFTSTNVITGVTTPITIILHHHHHHDQDHAKPDSEYLGALQVVLLPLATRPTTTVAKTGAPGDDDENDDDEDENDDDENDDGENDEDDDDNQLAAASESEDRCLGGSGLL